MVAAHQRVAIVLDADGEITQKTFYVSRIKVADDGKTGTMELLPE